MFVNKGQNLKDTQMFGKQSPQVTMSIGKSVLERASTSVKEKGGCYCTWNEIIYVEIKKLVEFIVVEVKAGSNSIGVGRIVTSQVSEFPVTTELQLTDSWGKKAGQLSYSVQKFTGSLNELHARGQELKEGRTTANVQSAANVFLNRVNRAPTAPPNIIPNTGGFHQPVDHTAGTQHHVSNAMPGVGQWTVVGTPNSTAPTMSQPTALPPTTTVRPVSLPNHGTLSRLPSFWEERTDTNSGKTYYVNHRTRETSWNRPSPDEHQNASSHDDVPFGAPITATVTAITATVSSITLPSELENLSKESESRNSEEGRVSEEQQRRSANLNENIPIHVSSEEERDTETDELKMPSDDKKREEKNDIEEESPHEQEQEHALPIPPTKDAPPPDISSQDANSSTGLPPHWQERMDRNSGKVYYVNHSTKETTWTKPGTSPVSTIDTAGAVGRTSTTDMSLAPNWQERVDQNSGRVYYVNHTTKETTWTRPTVAPPITPPSPHTPTASLILPPHWEERVDRNSGKVYYVNHATKETSWMRPQNHVVPPSPVVAAPVSSTLPPHWEERQDPNGSGKVYYVNHVTRQTTWERPLF